MNPASTPRNPSPFQAEPPGSFQQFGHDVLLNPLGKRQIANPVGLITLPFHWFGRPGQTRRVTHLLPSGIPVAGGPAAGHIIESVK